MANYLFLMELGNKTVTDGDNANLIKLTVTGCGFSFVGTMLSLCLICFLPVGNDSTFILTNLCISLVTSQLAFIAAENAYPEKGMCTSATVVIQYLFLVVHFCSFSYGIHLCSKLKNFGDIKKKRPVIVFMCWGAPLIISLLTVSLRGADFGKGALCWLPTEHGTRWAFLGPVMIIQIINWCVFLLMMATRFSLDIKRGESLPNIIKQQCLTGVSLLSVLGLTWTLGFIVTFGSPKVMAYVFVFLASTQGMLLFFCHVLTNNQVRKVLCVKMKPRDPDASVSVDYSEDYTRTSNVFEHSERNHSRLDHPSSGHSDNGVKMNRRRSEVVTKTEKFGHQLEVQQNQLHHRRRRSSGRKMSDN
ncbi:adhesion G-protein coupled receptor D1-like isoform X2 [Mytilus galloprovincialis]|uniref:adhesion G-protein coupled receptor D1-like isoform X2 n=1 Tax=Mytilus galloprovincialis TaxID=29158 RepID=UPI003F7BB9A7